MGGSDVWAHIIAPIEMIKGKLVTVGKFYPIIMTLQKKFEEDLHKPQTLFAMSRGRNGIPKQASQ